MICNFSEHLSLILRLYQKEPQYIKCLPIKSFLSFYKKVPLVFCGQQLTSAKQSECFRKAPFTTGFFFFSRIVVVSRFYFVFWSWVLLFFQCVFSCTAQAMLNVAAVHFCLVSRSLSSNENTTQLLRELQ